MAILKIRDAQGNVQEIVAIKGNDGKDGKDGKDYVLTDADKQEIAQIAAEIVASSIPSGDEVDY
jgi:hypothetical protein